MPMDWPTDAERPWWGRLDRLHRPGRTGRSPEGGIDYGRLRRRFPFHRVTLYDDDMHTMGYVVTSLVDAIPGTSEALAVAVMFEAHETGEAIAFAGVLEECEHFRDRLTALGLTVSMDVL